MKPSHPLRSLLLSAAALLLFAGCASTGGTGPSYPPEGAANAGPGLSAAEMEAIRQARLAEARTRFTPADVEFMVGMIHHHAQAIEISRLVPDRTATSSIRTLAARIINAQTDEIEIMQRWLGDRGQEVPEVHVTDTGVFVHGGGHHGAHGAAMPGMLTPEQIAGLGSSRDVDFDRIFLDLMIEHHRGAVRMVRDLIATDGAVQDEEVFRFASDVHVDQATEVARMERMLANMRGPGGLR